MNKLDWLDTPPSIELKEIKINIDNPAPTLFLLSTDLFFKDIFFNKSGQILRTIEAKISDTASCRQLLTPYKKLIRHQNDILIKELLTILGNTGRSLPKAQPVHELFLMVCIRFKLPKLFKVIFENIHHHSIQLIWQLYYLASYFQVPKFFTVLSDNKMSPPPDLIQVALSLKCSTKAINSLWGSLQDSDKVPAIDRLLASSSLNSPTSQGKMPTPLIQDYYDQHYDTENKDIKSPDKSFTKWLRQIQIKKQSDLEF